METDDLPAPGGSGDRITLTGVVQPGVEAGCLLLQEYLLVGGPRELFGTGHPVRVTGRVQPDLMTVCQQGIPLLVETAEPA